MAKGPVLERPVPPRVQKLLDKGRDFIVIGEHEIYYIYAYRLIRNEEKRNKTWTEQDERAFQEACQKAAYGQVHYGGFK